MTYVCTCVVSVYLFVAALLQLIDIAAIHYIALPCVIEFKFPPEHGTRHSSD